MQRKRIKRYLKRIYSKVKNTLILFHKRAALWSKNLFNRQYYGIRLRCSHYVVKKEGGRHEQ
jgi:hypothetical protein